MNRRPVKRRDPDKRRRIMEMARISTGIATVLAALALTAVPARADGHVCRSGGSDGWHFVLKTAGPTSCGMATATARAAIRREFPRLTRVTSPTTGKSYLMRRAGYIHTLDQFEVTYWGRGAGGRMIEVRVEGWA